MCPFLLRVTPVDIYLRHGNRVIATDATFGLERRTNIVDKYDLQKKEKYTIWKHAVDDQHEIC